MGEVTPFLCLFEIYGENSDSEKIFMASSSSWALYYEVLSWLKIQHSFANAPRTLLCLCSMWVFNKYYLMIRLNLGMTFYSCLWFTHLPGTHRCIWILFVKVKEPTWHLRKQSMHPLCVHSSYQWIYQQLLVILSPFGEKPTEDPYRGLWLDGFHTDGSLLLLCHSANIWPKCQLGNENVKESSWVHHSF